MSPRERTLLRKDVSLFTRKETCEVWRGGGKEALLFSTAKSFPSTRWRLWCHQELHNLEIVCFFTLELCSLIPCCGTGHSSALDFQTSLFLTGTMPGQSTGNFAALTLREFRCRQGVGDVVHVSRSAPSEAVWNGQDNHGDPPL